MGVTAEQTARFLRTRREAAAAAAERRDARVRSLLPGVAAKLRDELGASRVWLVGSHAVGNTHAESDVDLVVEGIEPCNLDRAGPLAESILGVPVDIVPIETAAPSWIRRLQAEGKLL